jgi:hypothetical protein
MWQSFLGRSKGETFISIYRNGEISTISEDGKEVIQPNVAFDYSANMGSVDLKDEIMQLSFGMQERE